MMKRNILKWIVLIIAIAINLFILVNSFISGDASTVESSAVVSTTAGIVNSISPGLVNNGNLEGFAGLIRKLFGHFGLFAASGAVSTWATYLFLSGTKFNSFWSIGGNSLFVGLAVAFISELIQVFMPGRNGSAADVVIDMLGYFIGVLLVILIIFLAKKLISSKNEQEEK